MYLYICIYLYIYIHLYSHDQCNTRSPTWKRCFHRKTDQRQDWIRSALFYRANVAELTRLPLVDGSMLRPRTRMSTFRFRSWHDRQSASQGCFMAKTSQRLWGNRSGTWLETIRSDEAQAGTVQVGTVARRALSSTELVVQWVSCGLEASNCATIEKAQGAGSWPTSNKGLAELSLRNPENPHGFSLKRPEIIKTSSKLERPPKIKALLRDQVFIHISPCLAW